MSVNYQKFLEYNCNKTVAIIGSGESILNEEYGEFINNHDIVVRINRGYPYERYRKCVGNRTDVWSMGMGGSFDLRWKMHLLMTDRKYSIYPWWDRRWVQPEIANLESHIFLPTSFSRAAAAYCGGHPASTGVDTIHYYIKATNYKQLSIFGMDFYRTGYWFIEEDSSRIPTVITKEGEKAHDVSKEEVFLERLVADNPNIKWFK